MKFPLPATALTLSLSLLTSGLAHAAPGKTIDLKDFSRGNSAALCQRLAEVNERGNVRILVIGFEGLGQYFQRNTDSMNRYVEMRRQRKDVAQLPGRGLWGGLLTMNLFLPLVKKNAEHAEFLAFGETDQPRFGSESVPLNCAMAWQRNPKNHLIIVGHSNGAQAATRLSHALNAKRVRVDAVFTIDGVIANGLMSKSENATAWTNFYQLLPLPLPGSAVSGANNVNLTGRASHGSMPGSQVVFDAISKKIAELKGVAVAAPAPAKPAAAPAPAAKPAQAKKPVQSAAPATARPAR